MLKLSKICLMLALFMAVAVLAAACSEQSPGDATAPADGGSGTDSGVTGSGATDGGSEGDSSGSSGSDDSDGSSGKQPQSTSLWMNVELTDVATGNAFAISDFAGKPVLVEFFAVWCPVCTRQQEETKKLEAMDGHDIVSVAVNIDSGEGEDRVRKHIEENGFDWYYAVARADFGKSLTDDFGLSIVHPPSAPVVLICPDQTVYKLRTGIKSADDLRDSVSEYCVG